jgi:uncharacterized membrane protein YdcZ (DUF606 family)
MLIGEGVLQVIRSVGPPPSQQGQCMWGLFIGSFMNLAFIRLAVFKMDCFQAHAKLHAMRQGHDWRFNGRLASLCINVIRVVFLGPALVALGVALKVLTYTANKEVNKDYGVNLFCSVCQKKDTILLWCCGCVICYYSLLAIYHIHRFMNNNGSVLWWHLIGGLLIGGLFFIFPWIPCVNSFGVLFGCMGIWMLALAFQYQTDDLFDEEHADHDDAHGHAHGGDTAHGHAHGDEKGHAHGEEEPHGHAHGDEKGHAHGEEEPHGHAHGDAKSHDKEDDHQEQQQQQRAAHHEELHKSEADQLKTPLLSSSSSHD